MKQQLLTAVRLVFNDQSPLAALHHVINKINELVFEESDGRWTLEKASERGFLRLLDRLLKCEWPGFSHHCRELRLQFAVKRSIEEDMYDVRVLEWWLQTYMPQQKQYPMDLICLFGIVHGRLDVLRWAHEVMNGQLSVPSNSDSPDIWCKSPEVVRWLYESGGRHLCLSFAFEPKCLGSEASLECFKWCLAHEDHQFLTIKDPELVLAEAIYIGHLEFVQWWHEHRPEICGPHVLNEIISYGHVHLAKWLHESYPEHHFSDLKWKYGGIRAMSSSDLQAIQWGVTDFNWSDDKMRLVWITDAMKIAAFTGDLNMLELVSEYREKIMRSNTIDVEAESGACPDSTDSVLRNDIVYWAAINGQLAILQWLENHHKDLQMPNHPTEAAFHAAVYGHLDALKWLHHHRPEGSGYRRGMNTATGNGHLEVVQWLHANRTEGCSVAAMDRAAKYGHLNVVQWLHENRTEGCTTSAMDMAARNGHLEVVKWLHENRTEGCTTDAMDMAASQGHLHVIQFLHSDRSEGCTAQAKAKAVENGHLETFKWLHENRSEGYQSTSRRSESLFRQYSAGHLNAIEFMARHTTYLPLGKLVYILINHGRFGAVEAILCDAQAMGGVVSIDPKYFETVLNPGRSNILIPLLSISICAKTIPPGYIELPARR